MKVTFESTDYMADYAGGTRPEFTCLNEHYDIEFVQGDAEQDYATGMLMSEKARDAAMALTEIRAHNCLPLVRAVVQL